MLRSAGLVLALLLAAPSSAAELHWFRAGAPTPQAQSLVRELNTAERAGLRSADYHAAELAAAVRAPVIAAASQEDLDTRLDAAAIRYVNDLNRGRIDPQRAGFDLRIARSRVDGSEIIARLSTSANVPAALGSYEPHFVHYWLLLQWLARYRELEQQRPVLSALPPLPHNSVKPGETYVGAGALRRLLIAVGDLKTAQVPTEAGDDVYDAALAAAVSHFQERLNLPADGVLGRKTWLALTLPLAQRIQQIELTLERWRWLPEFTTPPIIVNIPQFRLFAFRTTEDRYADILQMPVIVGAAFAAKRTPVFAADLTQLVFRPYWDVPSSILHKELLGPIRADPGYLARHHLEMVAGPGDDSKVVAATPENIGALAAGKLRLRQQPGPDNSLGPLKFVFPNDYGVYLHGTPAQELFARTRRDFSHGCIRLSDPAALAQQVLRGTNGDWSRERITTMMQDAPNSTRVALARPIRVMVLYGTALATEDGRLLLFDDIYGHDSRLARLLTTARRP